MSGRLDEISVKIGEQGAGIRTLADTFKQHCIDDDRRHEENKAELRRLTEQLTKLNECLAPLVGRVAAMGVIVDGYQISRWKRAGALGFAWALLVGVGWLIATFAGELVKWLASHWR